MANSKITPEILGPRYGVRLGDLRPWHVLRVTCLACGRVESVDPKHLARRRAASTRLVDIEHRFRCRACGVRGGVSWQIFRLPRD
jgi:hypothetical protein